MWMTGLADRFNPLFIGALRHRHAPMLTRRRLPLLRPWFQSPIHRGTSINIFGGARRMPWAMA